MSWCGKTATVCVYMKVKTHLMLPTIQAQHIVYLTWLPCMAGGVLYWHGGSFWNWCDAVQLYTVYTCHHLFTNMCAHALGKPAHCWISLTLLHVRVCLLSPSSPRQMWFKKLLRSQTAFDVQYIPEHPSRRVWKLIENFRSNKPKNLVQNDPSLNPKT